MKKKIWLYDSMLQVMGFFSASARLMQALLTDLTVSHPLALEAIMFLCSVSSLGKAADFSVED